MNSLDFEIVSDISAIETIAVGTGVRDRKRLRNIMAREGGVS